MKYTIIVNTKDNKELVFKHILCFIAEPGRIKMLREKWITVENVTGIILHEEQAMTEKIYCQECTHYFVSTFRIAPPRHLCAESPELRDSAIKPRESYAYCDEKNMNNDCSAFRRASFLKRIARRL